MKHFNRVLVIIFVIFSILAISINPLILFLVRRELKIRLPGSVVEIFRCRFNPLGKLSFSDIKINKAPVYDVRIRYLSFGFSLLSIFKAYQGDLPGIIESCDISLDSLGVNNARINNGYLKVARGSDNGVIGCAEFKYEKLRVTDIKAKASLKDDYLRIDPLSGRLLGGILKGNSFISLKAPLGYQADLNFTNLDLDIFMKDFAFDEKAEVTGQVSGFLKLQGENQFVRVLDGNLASGKEGGSLTIKDTRFLQNLARSSGQDLDLVVESFKNYRYNTAKTTIVLENNNIVFLINLNGSAGKRSLNLTFHDFNPGRTE